MKLTAKVKLQPTPEQAEYLLRTLERANEACDYISDVAWANEKFSQYPLHKLVYYDVRQRFELSAQVVIRCISKVADAYKLDKKTQRTFKPHGAIAYDSRILNWRMQDQTVSIWSIANRLNIPFLAGPRQLELLQNQRGESDLAYINGVFYLFATCNIEEPEPADVNDFLGVDLGIANIASDSDGNMHSGSQVKNVRHRHRRLRQKLQKKGTKSSRRRLKKLSGKERRFAHHTNHVISKQLVKIAQGTGRGIALEDLSGIRDRITARRKHRATLHSWSFFDLRQKISYKAQLAGVPVVLVDPRYTSQACSVCGCIDKRNRPNQANFSCVQCGFDAHADHNAAMNIRSRGVVNHPYVSDAPAPSA